MDEYKDDEKNIDIENNQLREEEEIETLKDNTNNAINNIFKNNQLNQNNNNNEILYNFNRFQYNINKQNISMATLTTNNLEIADNINNMDLDLMNEYNNNNNNNNNQQNQSQTQPQNQTLNNNKNNRPINYTRNDWFKRKPKQSNNTLAKQRKLQKKQFNSKQNTTISVSPNSNILKRNAKKSKQTPIHQNIPNQIQQ